MSKDSSHPQDKPGTPASLLVSLVSTIVVFAFAEIQNSFTLGESFAMRYTLMAYVALGLSLGFFWRRLERSPFLKIASSLYLFGLWVSLFMTTLAPILLRDDNPVMQGQVMQQFGLGFVAMSGLALIAAILQGQKMVPSLLFSALGAVGLFATSGAGFLVRSEGPHDGLIASHGKGHAASKAQDDEDGEEISSHNSMAAKAPAKDEHEVDGEKPSEHGDEHAAPAPGHVGDVEEAHETAPAKHPAKDNDDHHPAVQKSPERLKPSLERSSKDKKGRVASLENAIPEAKAHGASPAAKDHESHWSYESGAESPEHWGEIADDFRKCSIGQAQSPIDIPSAWPTMNDITLDYKLTPISIVDTGHTIQFNVGEQNVIRIAGKPYKLLQFHIHTPSEHWINGRASPMEIHFVHKDDKNKLAVIGVMVEQGSEQKVFRDMWGYVPQGLNLPASPRDKVFNIASLVPSKLKVYRYRGSLTTPPCSENVLWSVASESITMSKDQIDAFRMRYKNNARPIQKRAGTAH